MYIRYEPQHTRHVGEIRFGSSDPLAPLWVPRLDAPDPKHVDVWVATEQDDTVALAADLGIPVLCETLGPHVVHMVNGIIVPVARKPDLSWKIVNHLTCAVPRYLDEDLPVPSHRPLPFPGIEKNWRPLWFGEAPENPSPVWDFGTDVYNRVVYIGHRPDVSPDSVAVRGGVPVLDRAHKHWPRHCHMLRGAKNQFLNASVARIEKVQRAAFRYAWQNANDPDPCCP